jgi:hypothetical protein
MSFNGSTRTYSGTPPSGSSGNYTIACTASTGGPWSTITFTATVTAAAPAPPQYIGTINGWQYNYLSGPGASFSINASGQFRDPQGEALTYTAKMASGAALLSWINFNPSTQIFSGGIPGNTTTNDRLYTVQMTATDTSGLSSSLSFTIDDEGSSKQVVTRPSSLTTQTKTSTATMSAAASTSTTPNVQEEWFTYDADNRVVIDNGALVNGNIVMTAGTYYAPSYTNEYDQTGNVMVRKTINANTYTFQSGTTIKTYQAGDVMSQQMYYDTRNERVMTMFAVDVTQGETDLGVQTRQTYDADGHQLSTNTYLRSDTIHAVYGTHDEPNGYMYLGIGGWLANGEVSGYNADGQMTEQVSFSSDYRTGQWWLSVANNDNNTGNLPDGGANAVPTLSSDGPLVVGSTTSYTAYDHADNLTDYSFNENASPDGTAAAFGATYHVTYAKKDGYLQLSTPPNKSCPKLPLLMPIFCSTPSVAPAALVTALDNVDATSPAQLKCVAWPVMPLAAVPAAYSPAPSMAAPSGVSVCAPSAAVVTNDAFALPASSPPRAEPAAAVNPPENISPSEKPLLMPMASPTPWPMALPTAPPMKAAPTVAAAEMPTAAVPASPRSR